MTRAALGRSIHRGLVLGAIGSILVAARAQADPAVCQKAVLSAMAKFVKTYLKADGSCLDKENVGKLPGPCPDPTASLKIQNTTTATATKISASCTMADLLADGFPTNCQFESSISGKEGQCAALPVTTPAEFAQCVQCWKGAEAAEFLATLYASHADEVCGGSLGESSPQCSDLNFATPVPDQRNLGSTGEDTCQVGIGKGGINYLRGREKALEKCALAGGTQVSCLADATVQAALMKAEAKKQATIMKKCGNRSPVPSPPFCCKTGMANQCVAATSRDNCTMNLGGQVQEGKTCTAGTCAPTPGQTVTWWATCPETGTALTTRDDLISCVDASADQIVTELLCLQLRGSGGSDWPCPPADGSPSGAFVDPS